MYGPIITKGQMRILLILAALGVWKAVEIIIWLITHVEVTV